MHHELAWVEVDGVCEALAGVRCGGSARRGAAMGEHAVALGDDNEAGHFEPAAEVFVLAHQRAALPGGVDVGVQTRTGRFEKLRIARGLHAEFGEAGEGRRLEVCGRNALGRGVACEDDARERGELFERRHKGRVFVVLEEDEGGAWGKGVGDGWSAFRVGAADFHGGELGAFEGAGAGLQRGVERSERLEVVAEELGAYGGGVVWRPGVQHAAAHSELSRRLDFRRPFVSCRQKASLQVGEAGRGGSRRCREGEVDCGRGNCGRCGNWRCEGGGGGHDDERIRPQMVRAYGGCGLESRRRR